MATSAQRRKVVYVFPIFNERDNVDLLYRTLDVVTSPLRDRYDLELISAAGTVRSTS